MYCHAPDWTLFSRAFLRPVKIYFKKPSESLAVLWNLPERKRGIIQLSYFLELSDGEIGKKLNLIRTTRSRSTITTVRALETAQLSQFCHRTILSVHTLVVKMFIGWREGMRKNHIQNVFVHISGNTDHHSLADQMSQFHADIIERRLYQSGLTTEQKIQIIDKIIVSLKLREVDGIIK